MLPPILPLSVVPVTSQQDPVRPRPDIPPVVPAQAAAGESAINLSNHDSEQATLLLREEQQRQQQKRRSEAEEQEAQSPPDAEDAGPQLPAIDGTQRLGLWVDIKV